MCNWSTKTSAAERILSCARMGVALARPLSGGGAGVLPLRSIAHVRDRREPALRRQKGRGRNGRNARRRQVGDATIARLTKPALPHIKAPAASPSGPGAAAKDFPIKDATMASSASAAAGIEHPEN